jgi:DNA-binding Lrp family transcriptional regulator
MSKKKLLRSLDGIAITAEDAGRLLGRSRQWVEKLVARGFVKRVGGLYRPADVVSGALRHMTAARRTPAADTLAAVQFARAAEIRRRLARDDKNIIEVDELVAVTSENIEDLRARLAGAGSAVTADADMAAKIDAKISDAFERATTLLARRVAELRAGGAATVDDDVEESEDA